MSFNRCTLLTAFAFTAILVLPVRAALLFEQDKVETQPSATDVEVVARYPFRNAGTTTVRVTAIQSDCSCTTPTLAKKSYAPGDVGEVVVKFEIGNRHGLQKKTVVLSTDDPSQATQTLSLTAAIPQILTIAPNALLWTEAEARAGKTINVKTPDSPAVSALRANARSAALQVSVERVGPTEFRVLVTPDAKARNVSTALYLDAVLASGVIKRSTAFIRVR